ncbi:MAG: BMP family protein [Sphaerochaeta sp.]|nr:BMP family protein [Sphaerochaeta sp.]
MKKILLLMLCLVLVGSAVYAGGSQEAAPAAQEDSNVVKIALIIENTIDDKGWCQAMHDGILEAQAQMPGRIEYTYSEKMKPVDAGSAARQFVAQGYDIIIAHGAQYKNLILEMADEYPKVTFAFGTSSEVGPANVFTYMPESEETGYLSGLIAGMTTKANIVGIVGPVDAGDAARYNRGYVLGVKDANPNARIMVAHSGSFSDFIKAGEIAQSQIKSGADVLSGSSQQALGALRAVADYRDKDIWWVGQDIAQIGIPEGYKVIAASSYNYAAVVVGLVEKLDAGITGGMSLPMNFNNGGFIFKFNSELASIYDGAIKTKVDQTIAAFKAKPNTVNYTSVDYSKL